MGQEGLMPIAPDSRQTLAVLRRCNDMGAAYGLVLSEEEMGMLVREQTEALRRTGRVEFGHGPYQALVYALCDSPYLRLADYAETLAAFCQLFYQFKGEAGERWSDDELIGEMKRLFDGPCHGSLELLGDRLWQSLHEPQEDPEEEEEDADAP